MHRDSRAGPNPSSAQRNSSNRAEHSAKASAAQAQEALLEAFFLPDLCNTRAVMFLLMLVEALVLALVLVESGIEQFSWQRFSLVSLFVQWVALLSVAALCQLRRVMVRLPVALASALAMSLILLITAAVSLMGEWLWPEFRSGIDWMWVLRNLLIATIFAAMALRYFYVQSQWRLKTQAELQARLSALQANIRPHFFFNTLNTVASLIMIDADKAERMLIDLAQLFRAVLKADDVPVALSDEIELGYRYLAIEQVRLGERMQVSWQLPEQIPALKVPQLMLQPLLENAVYHGIQPLRQGGEISIRLSSENKARSFCLEIRNPLPAPDELNKPRAVEGNQLAHANIRARLATLNPDDDQANRLETEQHDGYFIARLILANEQKPAAKKEMNS